MNEYISAFIGQVIRHFLTLAAGLLTAYGVTADQQDSLVSATTAVIVSVVLFLISQIWAAKTGKAQLEAPSLKDVYKKR